MVHFNGFKFFNTILFFILVQYVLDQKDFKNTDPPLDFQKKIDDSHHGATSMILDNKTLMNLDVIPFRERDNNAASLFSVVDKTITPIGKRLKKS